MKKKTLLCTTIAGTMFIAGLAMPTVNAAVSEGTKTIVNEDNFSAYVQLANKADSLTRADVESLVNEKYSSYGVKVSKIAGEDLTDANKSTAVRTGAKITLSNGNELTLVLYGDISVDGKVDTNDLDLLSQVLVGKGSLNDENKTSVAADLAADIVEGTSVDANDLDVLSQFLVGKSDLVDSTKLPENVIYATIGAKVKVPTSYDGKNGLWSVEPNATHTEVTLKISDPDASSKVSFDLTDVPTGTTLGEHSDDVTYSNSRVSVPRKVGTYTLTLTSDGKSQTITINVKDVTLAAKTAVTFEEIQEEDAKKISDENVRANTQEVYKDANNPSLNVSDTTTFHGNVNNMGGNKTYKARIKVSQEGMTNKNVKVAYVKGNEVIRITPEAVEGTDNTMLVELDATMTTTKLVVVPEEATDDQIKAAIAAGKCDTVKFESTSKLQIRNATVPTQGTGTAVQNQKNFVMTAEHDDIEANKITIGVKLSELKDINLNTETHLADAKSSDKTKTGKWVPVNVVLLENATANLNLSSAISLNDAGNDFMLHKTDVKDAVYLWVNADKAGEKQCTLVYTEADGYTEKLTLTIDIKDASDPIILSAVAGTDENSKGVIVTKDPVTGNKEYTIKIDTYKYAMNPNITRKTITDKDQDKIEEIKGRWYSVILETNIPAESLMYYDEKDSKWVSLPSDYITKDGKITIWVQADTDMEIEDLQQKIGNKYAGLTNDTGAITLKIDQKEKTYVDLHGVYKISGKEINANCIYTNRALSGIEIDEIDNEDLSFKHNLEIAKTLTKDNNQKVDYSDGIAKITIPVNDVVPVTVNNKEGRWIVMYLVTSSLTIKDENGGLESGIYVDSANKGALVTKDNLKGENGEQWYNVPVWINLDNDKVKAAISKNNSVATPIEIKFSHDEPVKETNSLKVTFVDANAATSVDTTNTKNPTTAEVKDIIDMDEEEQKTASDRWLSGATKPQSEVQAEDVKALQNNAEKVKDIEIKTFGNTVHVKITADLKALENGTQNHPIIPLELDMSAISKNTGNVYINMSKYGYGNWGQCTDTVDYDGDTFYLGATYEDGKVQDIYLTKANDDPGTFDPADNNASEITTPYIHYVIEFVQG